MKSKKGASKVIHNVLAFLVALSLVALGGCAGATGSSEIPLKPTIASPAIATDGVLRVGVDSGNAPYAGLDENTKKIVGIDVDIAAALAEELGLKLEIVDTAGLNIDALLAEKTIDMVMAVEQVGSVTFRGTLVGPYVISGPALFTVVKSNTLPSVDIASLAGIKIAAQNDSLSAWTLEELIGTDTVDPRASLKEAFQAVESGEVSYAAADAVVGSYLALEYKDLSCVKILGTPIGVCMGVAADNTQLADALTNALRTIRDNGVLKLVLSKWIGPVSAAVIMGSSAITSQGANGLNDMDGSIDYGDDLPDPALAGGV